MLWWKIVPNSYGYEGNNKANTNYGSIFSARINPQVLPTTPRQSDIDKESTMHLTHRIATTLPICGDATMFDPKLKTTRFASGGTKHAYGTTKHGTSTIDCARGANEEYEWIKNLPFNY